MLLLQVFLLQAVWKGVYGDRDVVNGVTLETMVAYATLAAVQYKLLNPLPSSLIPDRVRDGKVSVDLLRPTAFPVQMMAAQIGLALAGLPAVVVALPFAVLIGGAQMPSSITVVLAYLLSLALGLAVNQFLFLLVGLVAFWTLETTGADMVYRFTAQFLSGGLVPLWFMPGALRRVAELLPFQATTYTPVAIYLEELQGREVIAGLLIQSAWVVILFALAGLVWRRAQRRVTVQGG